MNDRTMKGLCAGLAILLVAVFMNIPLILIQLEQVEPDDGPDSEHQSGAMVEVNVSGYGNALSSAFSDPILGLYTDNVSAPLNARAGLRQVYKFGIHSHCAYVNKTAGSCTGTTFAYDFQPFTVITNDMLSNYSDYTNTILGNSTFANASSLARSSRAANHLLSLGLILSISSFLIGPIWFIHKQTWPVIVSASAAVLAPIPVLVGSAIWTTIIREAKVINSWTVQPDQHPLGIKVSAGSGLTCAWVAFALLAAGAIVPAIILIYWVRTLSWGLGRGWGWGWRRCIPSVNWGRITGNRMGRSPYAAQPERSHWY